MKNEAYILEFGEHLKKLRKSKKYSQQYLADISEVHLKTIQRIERNKLNPTLDMLYSIAQGFNISVSKLLDFPFEE